MQKIKTKIIPILTVILICISFSACADEAQDDYSEGSGVTVYVTDSGEKYHRANCKYLSNSKNAIDLEDAKNRGYGRCSVCKPSTE